METSTMNLRNTKSNFIIENKFRIIFIILLFVLTSLKMFGQTTTPISNKNEVEVAIVFNQVQTSIVSLDSPVDFVSWFMGSRQSQMNENESANKYNSTSTKKQILNAGVTPNKLLYRTFMKKVISQDSVIV